MARWREDGEARVLFCVPAPVRAALVVDAHVVALLEGARPTLVHEGDVTDVAFEAAQRLGVELVHVDALLPAPVSLPSPEPAPHEDLLAASLGALPPVEPALAPLLEAPLAIEALEIAVAAAEFPDLIEVPLAPLVEPEPLLAAPEPVPLLPAHVEAFPDPILVPDAPLVAVAVGFPALMRVPDHALPGAFEPEYEVAAALPDVAPEAPEVVPALPWTVPAPAEAAPALALPEEELDAMPWSPRFHHEIMQGAPRRVEPIHHPSVLAAPQGPNWGLPWPRPPTPDGGLAMHDPALWGARERVAAVREDLAQKGSASFGAVKPEGSAWLKRIQHFGSP